MGWVGDITRQIVPQAAKDLTRRAEQLAPSQEAELARKALGGDRLVLSNAARQIKPNVLDASALAGFDGKVNELAGLSQDTKDKLNAFYAPMYQNPDLQERANKAIAGWVWGGKGKVALRDAYSRVIVGKAKPETDLENLISELSTTRRARWQRLASSQGLPMPDAFKLYRGVRGDYAVDEVLRSWMDDSTEQVRITNHELSSWSTDPAIADKFVHGENTAAVYKADIPFDQTVLDKWSDGGPLVSLGYDQNEVVVGAAKDSLTLPKRDITLTYKGQAYTYAQRNELLAAWQKDHPTAA
jgi:hypothetical protein